MVVCGRGLYGMDLVVLIYIYILRRNDCFCILRIFLLYCLCCYSFFLIRYVIKEEDDRELDEN